jgi:hypothetical protein
MRALIRVVIVMLAAVLGGCASPGPTTIDIPAGGYGRAFDAARRVLADYHFELERVDAAAGVISTRPKTTAGLATPWDTQQSTFEQSVDDLVNRQARSVRITFDPQAPGDVREATGPIAARVEVNLERTCRAGWRLDPTAVRLSTFYVDPELQARGLQRYSVVIAQDPLLAARIARDVKAKLTR